MQIYPYLDELLYCLERNFPAPLTEAMLALLASPSDVGRLQVARTVWIVLNGDDDEFADTVEEITGDSPVFCDDCGKVVWEFHNTDLEVCDSCLNNYGRCDYCENVTRETTDVGSNTVCESCLGNHYAYCGTCEEYIDNDNDEHGHTCTCDAPHLRFEFPNDGHGTVSQNERITVELPKGTIDDEGMRHISNLVEQAIANSPDDQFFYIDLMQEVGPLWQMKRGNFTRRLSSVLHSQHQFKLPSGVLSEVGNIARAHSSDDAEWHVSFTRHLNGSAEDFCHDESCWFTGGRYGKSRCALKQWGGLALRTWDDDCNGVYRGMPNGRAWVQPLNADLNPTHDIANAHAYIVYNGYGDLEGYVAARIVAHLTSLTYRKVEFYASPQFINGDTGYLIADETTCSETGQVQYSYDEHYKTDAHQLKVKVYA